MRVPRFHVDTPLSPDVRIELPPQTAAHALRVLRLQPGDAVILFNGDGHDYAARLVAGGSREVAVHVETRVATMRESPLRITLAQALARGEKMDWIVQKAVELGVAAVIPLVTERSEVKLDDKRVTKRLEHWRAVAIAACEQSGRAIVPLIEAPQALDRWLATLERSEGLVRLALHPGEGLRARALQPAPRTVTLAIGPEGGFGERDLAVLRTAGFANLSLGPRILRTETAGVAVVAALQALYGDI
ncbi:MAG: 16S rRNA (uracil(1498)-N(3))-methyltransferase [Xanthomonadales bacterium]|nr:16S rRNA (uracil(1498)-N(3))-methyltransferase [Xanthomonadales bacterium]ODU92499.1 MAG: 16S rRNA (uracil(1498)-N(3))-methyltransferase [Rhodanobacter sp. SCN 66-43]OJY86524.1 MAG: 16S rRNA (uracil(1498)-N(3))-methyltransferase [Xanthomonadales bacterium 66-474]